MSDCHSPLPPGTKQVEVDGRRFMAVVIDGETVQVHVCAFCGGDQRFDPSGGILF